MNVRGFTLVELSVALLVTSTILLLATGLLSTLETGPIAGFHSGVRRMGLSNARVWLRSTIVSVDMVTPSEPRFDGGPTAVGFSSIAWQPDGWWESTGVVLVLEAEGIVARLGSGQKLLLYPGAETLEFQYLIDSPRGRRWLAAWESRAGSPLAIRMIVDRVDTLHYVIGGI